MEIPICVQIFVVFVNVSIGFAAKFSDAAKGTSAKKKFIYTSAKLCISSKRGPSRTS